MTDFDLETFSADNDDDGDDYDDDDDGGGGDGGVQWCYGWCQMMVVMMIC